MMAEHRDSYNPYIEVAPGSPALSPNPRKARMDTDDALEMKNLPMSPSPMSPAPTLGYYPASLATLTIWLTFIIIMVWLLESAVAHGPRSTRQPWSYTTLPSLLLTVFAQGHGAVTAMHLARVSVSALHSPRTSPNTWAEVFWISDRAWQGPVGILSTILAASRLRVRTSTHFILCAVTCLTALITPIILSRAYPIRNIVVEEQTVITPFVLSVAQMGSVDAWSQIGTGIGSWSTALSIADTYNSSVYLPPGTSRAVDPTDFFFAGSTGGRTATLPGLRLSGQCVPVESTVSSFADFPAFCHAQIADLPYMTAVVSLTPAATNISIQACTNKTWGAAFSTVPPISMSSNVAYIYINSANNTYPGLPGIVVEGMVRCDSQASTGRARLTGNGTYTSFTEEPMYNQTQGGEPILDPLYAMLFYFGTHVTSLNADSGYRAAVARALGFVGTSPRDGAQTSTQPSLKEMATAFWRGVSYTVAGVGLLSRTNDTTYPAVQSGVAAVYVREPRFASAAYTLLGVWLLLLVVVSVRSFRPTFGGSFDSYVTAKLVLDRPGLVQPLSGELAENPNLRERFGRVGRDSLGRVVTVAEGH